MTNEHHRKFNNAPKSYWSDRETTSTGNNSKSENFEFYENNFNKRPKFDENFDQSNGTLLNRDMVDYLVSLASDVALVENDPEMLDTLVQRCKDELTSQKADPVGILCSQTASQALESIAGLSSDLSIYVLQLLLTCKRKNVVQIFNFHWGGRCMETMLYKMAEKYFQEIEDKKDAPENAENPESSTTAEISTIIKELCEIFVQDIDNLCVSRSGSHILRCIGQILCGFGKSGAEKSDNFDRNSASKKSKTIDISPVLIHCFGSLSNFILDWNYIHGYLDNEPVSLVVQDYIELDALYAKTQYLGQFCNACTTADQRLVSKQICSKQASRVYEKLVKFCDESTLERFVDTHCKTEVKNYALHHFGNFVVQRVLERCTTEEMFTDLFDELTPVLDDLWSQKKFGVVISLIKASAKSKCKQKAVKKVINQHLEIGDHDNKALMILAILQLRKLSELENDESGPLNTLNIQLHGSLMIQNLLKFKQHEDLMESLFAMKNDMLIALMCHHAASRIFDTIFTIGNIKSDFLIALFEKMKADLHKLACDKNGSHILEAVWNTNLPTQETIRSQIRSILIKKSSAVTTNPIGRIIWAKFQLFQSEHGTVNNRPNANSGNKFKKFRKR